METKDIKIGRVYDIKVGKNTTAVRIMKPAPDGGWEAVSLATEKPLVIKSADRILGLHNPKANKAKGKTPAETDQEAVDTPKPAKRLSALDAAAKVLAESTEPLNCKQLIETMTTKGYWAPSHSGKTPANTLHAAISKEIKAKADQSRFKKAERGQFTLNA